MPDGLTIVHSGALAQSQALGDLRQGRPAHRHSRLAEFSDPSRLPPQTHLGERVAELRASVQANRNEVAPDVDREVASHHETNLLDILEQEREALRRGDIRTVLALVDKKLEAAKNSQYPIELARFRQLAMENHDLLAHLLVCWRSVLITTVNPDGTLWAYGQGTS